MLEIDPTDEISLRNASYEEIKFLVQKLDRYVDYGSPYDRKKYREHIKRLARECRKRKSGLLSSGATRGRG
jgi:hypothetical protein